MNKKFTFMVAALLAAGSFSANAAIETGSVKKVTELKDGGQYYLVFDGDEATDNANSTYDKTSKEFFLGVKNSNGTISPANAVANAEGASLSDKALLWTVKSHTQADGKVYYSFYNAEAETYLTMSFETPNSATAPAVSSSQVEELKAVDAKKSSYFSFSSTSKKYDGTADHLYVIGSQDNASCVDLDDVAIRSVATSTKIFYAVEAAPAAQNSEAGAKLLNGTMAGDGFSFAPVNDKTPVDDANNLFSKTVKAFYVSETTADEQTIPAGMYFATEWPEELNDKNTFGDSSVNSEDAKEALSWFEQCTFIAVSPKESYQTSSVTADGLKLVEVSGAELVKYDQEDEDYATKGDKVYVGNAAFDVTLQNPTAEKEEDYKYTLKVKNIRWESEADKEHTEKAVSIVVTKISGTYYVTTDEGDPTEFKAVDSTVADPMSFVADEKMPSIYNIQFVSEVANEKGKYLGVAVRGIASPKFEFVAQGEALVDLEAPQYRFVVSAVDTENKKLTFTNWETGANISAKLYEVKEGVYRLKSVGVSLTSPNLAIADEDVVDATKYDATNALEGMEITLTKVDAAPTAGFLVKEKNNNEPYKISFAKTETSSDRLYVAENLKTTSLTDLTLSDKAGEALQVIFEPVLKNGSEEVNNITTTKTTYIYKNEDGLKLTSSAYMGTYYKYNLRVVGTEDQYIHVNGTTWELSSTPTTYIAKVNPEGSVSLMTVINAVDATEVTANAATSSVVAAVKYGYLVPNSDDAVNFHNAVSLFLEAEELGLSLEAKSQHVSLEAERGGFLNVNEANEGVVAIRTEAAEDLTFWLDTTDSKALIPSFYISKGGKFMYNSADSAKIGVPNKENAKYIVSVNSKDAAKAIFKAGELVDSETLKTTVDKKETTVKVKADQNKGILGGLKNFQYNIVKPNDTEDNYVIRSANDNRYLTSVNNVLAFISDKDNAMRVIVETQSAPTSNEGVSATEVKVGANEGSVVVKNAAGKNVVVSTILGQVVANEVLTSDNATINVPAGIVVVAVEGESFKVNVK